jgi:hypothetical protein
MKFLLIWLAFGCFTFWTYTLVTPQKINSPAVVVIVSSGPLALGIVVFKALMLLDNKDNCLIHCGGN